MKPKMFYAPDWELGENPDKSEGIPDPLTKYGTTPEKWEYYNTVFFKSINSIAFYGFIITRFK